MATFDICEKCGAAVPWPDGTKLHVAWHERLAQQIDVATDTGQGAEYMPVLELPLGERNL